MDIRGLQQRTLLFLRPRDPALELWDGARLGVNAAPNALGVDEAHVIQDFDGVMASLMEHHTEIYHALGVDRTLDEKIIQNLEMQRGKVRQGIHPIEGVVDFRPLADNLRLIKSDWEIARIALRLPSICRSDE
jgi:Xaa-Pro aminopeptidase